MISEVGTHLADAASLRPHPGLWALFQNITRAILQLDDLRKMQDLRLVINIIPLGEIKRQQDLNKCSISMWLKVKNQSLELRNWNNIIMYQIIKNHMLNQRKNKTPT